MHDTMPPEQRGGALWFNGRWTSAEALKVRARQLELRLQHADIRQTDVIGIASTNHRVHIDLLNLEHDYNMRVGWCSGEDETFGTDIPISEWKFGFFDDRHLPLSQSALHCIVYRMGEYESWLAATALVDRTEAPSRAIAQMLTTSDDLSRPTPTPVGQATDLSLVALAGQPHQRLLVAESLADPYWRTLTQSAMSAGIDIVLLPQQPNDNDFIKALAQKPTALALSPSSAALFAQYIDEDADWLSLPRLVRDAEASTVEKLLSGF